MAKIKIKPPKSLKARLKTVGKKHGLGSVDDVVAHFILRGLKQYEVDTSADEALSKMEDVVAEQGYSSKDELVEHLLMRGLHAYEEGEDDPKKLEERLRGLGYID